MSNSGFDPTIGPSSPGGTGGSGTVVAGANITISNGNTVAVAGSPHLTGTTAIDALNINSGGVIAHIGTGLAIAGGTLSATAAAPLWTASAVSALGAGLVDTGGTLSATAAAPVWNAGTVTLVGTGLALSAGTLSATGGATIAGNPLWNIPNNPTLAAFGQIGMSGTVSTVTTSGTSNTIMIADTGSAALKLVGLTIAAPVAPYRIAMLAFTNGANANFDLYEFGWSDGTKYDTVAISPSTAQITHENWTNATTRATTASQQSIAPVPTYAAWPGPMWLGLWDDGTNVHMQLSTDGVIFVDYLSFAKSAGNLGASGYTKIFFGLAPDSSKPTALTVRCYDPNGLTRAFP